jgi:hypothetical protein
MLSTINLDDQPLLPAEKIDNKWSDCLLPHELEAAEPTVANRKSQLPLGVGLLATEPALNANRPTIRSSHNRGSTE